jgi:hypothetical protein
LIYNRLANPLRVSKGNNEHTGRLSAWKSAEGTTQARPSSMDPAMARSEKRKHNTAQSFGRHSHGISDQSSRVEGLRVTASND